MFLIFLLCVLQLTLGAYHKAEYGQFCSDSGTRITSAATCKDAATALGLEWGQSWWGPWDFPGCLHTKDSRNKVYFNLSLHATNSPNNPNYAEICTGKGGINFSPQCTKLSGRWSNYTHSVHNVTSEPHRCGPEFPLRNGDPSQCWPESTIPCCSSSGWCGNSYAHCNCQGCVNYSPSCVNYAALTCPSFNRNTHLPRDDEVLNSIVSAEECSNKCRGKITCNFWTWHNNNLNCVLMSGYGFTAFDNNVISGPRACHPTDPGVHWSPANPKLWFDSECPNVGNMRGTLEDCKKKCVINTECTAFNFNTVHGGCALRGCPIPVPPPTSQAADIVGYFMTKG